MVILYIIATNTLKKTAGLIQVGNASGIQENVSAILHVREQTRIRVYLRSNQEDSDHHLTIDGVNGMRVVKIVIVPRANIIKPLPVPRHNVSVKNVQQELMVILIIQIK